MAQTVTVGTTPVRVTIPTEGATVSNSGATVYHSARDNLTTDVNDGSIASGSSGSFDASQYFICATTTTLTVDVESFAVAQTIVGTQAAGGTVIQNKLLAADANPAYKVLGDGKTSWGSGGASAVDTQAARSNANSLSVGDPSATSNQMRIGKWASSTYGVVGNEAALAAGANSYALLQGPTGDTYINAATGLPVSFRINHVEVAIAAVNGFTPSAGLLSPTAVSVNNYVAGQAPTATTSGTDTTPVSGTIFFGQVFVPANTTLTGISYLIGTVGGTNNVIVGLYNNAGTLVKSSALAGTLVGTAATMQRVPFTGGTYAAVGPAMYWVSVSMNGTTARLRTHTFGDHAANSATGVFGTLAAITPVTTFTANTAPYAMTY